MVAGVGLPGVGKSTIFKALGNQKNWKHLCEPEESDWPLAVKMQEASGAFTALTWFRAMRVPNLFIADSLRQQGQIVLVDSYYDKLMTHYIKEPNMEWLMHPNDPYFQLTNQMALADNINLPTADIMVFFEATFISWKKLIMSRKRQLDLERVFPDAFLFQNVLLKAAEVECKKGSTQLIVFENEYGSIDRSTFKLGVLLENLIDSR